MCDFNSVISAWSSMEQGRTQAMNAKSQGEFEAVQMQAQGIISAANMRSESTELRRSFNEMYSRNTAAQALTGLDPESFKAIEQSNKANQRFSEGNLDRQAGSAREDAEAGAKLARIGANIEAKLARKNGQIKALDTLLEAENEYQRSNTGTTRLGHATIGMGLATKEQLQQIGGSLGGSFFVRKT